MDVALMKALEWRAIWLKMKIRPLSLICSRAPKVRRPSGNEESKTMAEMRNLK